MKRSLLVGAMLLAIAACTTAQVTTAAQTSEKVDTEAADLYVAIATYLNADETATPGNVSKDEALKMKAWSDWQMVHAAYLTGQVLTTASLATLSADQAAAGAPASAKGS
jgi:hypothetical protein